MITEQLKQLLGPVPDDKGDDFKHRQRLHQGWWRMVVMGEEYGPRPNSPSEKVCNTIRDGDRHYSNFLTENTQNVVRETLENRGAASQGLIDKGRLFNNLLSSQPLCFNFWAELKADLSFAATVVRHWIPGVRNVIDVRFEYAPTPPEDYTDDNSACDVAIEFETDEGAKGIWGVECKYTDTFSPTVYDKPAYRNIYDTNRSFFAASYEKCIKSQYNQLFRNHLIALALSQNKKFDIAFSGLLCHQDDDKAITTGKEFQKFFVDGEKSFKIVTYADYISVIQRLHEATWEQREWSMMLWARYCANQLSDVIAR